MLEILQFIFSSGWVFLGSVIILSIIISGITSVFKSIITYKLIKTEYEKLDRLQKIRDIQLATKQNDNLN